MPSIKERIGPVRGRALANIAQWKPVARLVQTSAGTQLAEGLTRIGKYVKAILEAASIGRWYGKTASTEAGKALIMARVQRFLDARGVKTNVKQLAEARGITKMGGRTFVNTLVRAVAEEAGDSKIIHGLKVYLEKSRGTVIQGVKDGKPVFWDTSLGKVFLPNGEAVDLKFVRNPADPEFKEMLAKMSQYGIKMDRRGWVNVMLGNIFVDAIVSSPEPSMVEHVFTYKLNEEMARNPIFSEAMKDVFTQEFRAYSNRAALGTALFEMIKLPSYMVGLMARAVARVMALVPFFGSVAATQAELGAALTDLGERISDKITSSAYVWHSGAPELAGIRHHFMEEVAMAAAQGGKQQAGAPTPKGPVPG